MAAKPLFGPNPDVPTCRRMPSIPTSPPLPQDAPKQVGPLVPRTYSLAVLVVLTFIGPPILAVLWFFTHSIAGIVGFALFAAFFWLWYWMLLKSQSLHPRTRGEGLGSG